MKKSKVPGYARRVEFESPSAKVFPALTTPEGLQSWWTTLVQGSGETGTEWLFEFQNPDEKIRMQIEIAEANSVVEWLCVEHSLLEEWVGTRVRFELMETAGERCQINFKHIGLAPGLACYSDSTLAWDLCLESLMGAVDRGQGEPFASR